MTKKDLNILLLFWLAPIIIGYSQSNVLPIETYLSNVVKYHPRSKQAFLREKMAQANVLRTKGLFDPTIKSSFDNKTFDNKRYFSVFGAEVNIPTWPGIDLKLGHESNSGIFINPERTLPVGGLSYLGVSIPLLQGLMIDDRRTRLQEAKIGQEIATLDANLVLNQLLFDAIQTYWRWFVTFHNRRIIAEALSVAQVRYNGIRMDAIVGDRPGIDTIEASIQIQNLEIRLVEANNLFVQQSVLLSNFVWNDKTIFEIDPKSYTPVDIDKINPLYEYQPILDITLDQAAQHPLIDRLEQVNKRYEILNKNFRDKLKPNLRLQINPLLQQFGDAFNAQLLTSNYKAGIQFTYPILLRSELGNIKLNNFQIQENQFLIKENLALIYNDLRRQSSEWQTTTDLVRLYNSTAILSKTLLDAEIRLFEIGESSLFLVNSREQAYIQALIQKNEAIARNSVSYFRMYFISGQLPRLIDNQ